MNNYNISGFLDFQKIINSPLALLGIATGFVLMTSNMSPTNLVQNYSKSFLGLGSKFPNHNIKSSLQLVIGAVFAGYTATAFPPEFLKIFEHPLAQFFIFFLLFNSNEYSPGFPMIFVVIDAVLFTIMIQIVLKIVKELYKKNEQKNKE